MAALSNADEFDFNLITTPGLNYQYNPYLISLVLEICENRGDAFYIMDIAPNQAAGAAAIENVVSMASQFDSNYGATYYPWVKIVDTNSNRVIPVPPSVVMMSVFAANDQVAAEWFAGRVNPIAAFPGQGIVAWGQKTLQRQPSALDRISVRRLLIALKKFIASSSRYLVFEQNVASTRQRFLNIVNPYLDGVQQRSGLYAFKVVMDDSNNTPDLVDRNILYGQIYLKPSKTAEFIVLDFNVLPTGAVFPGA
jgi:phage tail sheath protein FI